MACNPEDKFWWWLYVKYDNENVYYRRVYEPNFRSAICKALLVLKKMPKDQRDTIVEFALVYAPCFDVKTKAEPCWARFTKFQSLMYCVENFDKEVPDPIETYQHK